MRSLWCGTLILALLVIFSKQTQAQAPTKPIVSTGTIVGVIVGVVAVVAVVTYVVIHQSTKKRTITGCVFSGENGMSVTDEKDKRSYLLSGSTADIKTGDRVTLQGKKIKQKDAGKPLLWETKAISKDFGVCAPHA